MRATIFVASLLASLLLAGCAGPVTCPIEAPVTQSPDVVQQPIRPSPRQPMRPVGVLQSSCEHERGFSVGEHSYCVLQTPLSWHEASRRCAEHGGRLAQFETRAEQKALELAVRSPLRPNSVWIGLSRGRGEWKWADGPLRYDGWSRGEPNNAGGREQCGEWLRGNGLFNDLSCDQRRAVLCEAPSESNSSGTSSCGGESIHTEAGSYCLYDEERVSWQQAQALCQEGGMRLASLPSEGHAMQLAEALASGLRAEKLWIGLSDEAQEGQWRWSSGAALTGATGWGQNQPDNYNGEHCGEWRINQRDWNDMRCDAPRGALCEF